MKSRVAEIRNGWQNLNAVKHNRGTTALRNGHRYARKVTRSSLYVCTFLPARDVVSDWSFNVCAEKTYSSTRLLVGGSPQTPPVEHDPLRAYHEGRGLRRIHFETTAGSRYRSYGPRSWTCTPCLTVDKPGVDVGFCGLTRGIIRTQ